MTQQVFPDLPELADLKSQRSFSLPQQNYLLSFFLLEHCKDEAQRWLEGDYPAEELERMNWPEKWERLNEYQEQLRYDEALETFIQARNHLIEWGFDHLRQGPQTPPVVEILAQRKSIVRRPRLRDAFVEICMRM